VLVVAAHATKLDLYVPFLVTVSANGAIALARGRQGRPSFMGLVGAAVPAAAARAVVVDVPAVAVTTGGMAGLLLYFLLRSAPFPGRRLVASGVAGVLAWALGG
jgi:hypothetical protein